MLHKRVQFQLNTSSDREYLGFCPVVALQALPANPNLVGFISATDRNQSYCNLLFLL